MADLRYDVSRHMRLAGRGYTHRLVILDIERGHPPGNHLPISRDDIAGIDLIPQAGHPLVDGHATGFDQAIGLPPRTYPVVCEKFIDAKLVGHSVGMPFQ